SIVFSMADFVLNITLLAALSFIGFGVQPPAPEWGSMIAEGRDYIFEACWIATLPGLVIVFTGAGLARALAVNPSFLVLDEPMAALDVSIQAQVLNLLQDLRDELDLAMLFIAHELSVVRHISRRVAVMYLGRIVEQGTADEIFQSPEHPYTQSLLRAVPRLEPRKRHRKAALKGDIPSPLNIPPGCRFHPRCDRAKEICRDHEPETIRLTPTHSACCHLVG
ncbi:MAG: hypothetical protein JRJ26_20585, partial [Deltaproteobacteria bacterium]|nr:hypothetical protein [Deltaproteobacteria bacterium]